MTQFVLAVDVDGVLADLHAEWYKRYNEDYADDLQPERVTAWGVHEFVKPECGKKIYDYLKQADLYDYVPPVEGALEAVTGLRNLGLRIVYATSCVRGMADQKWEWLERHGFLPEAGQHGTDDLVIVHDKSLVRADALVDDYAANLKSFGARGILFDAPHNRKAIGEFWRVESWPEIVGFLAPYGAAA